MQEEVGCGRVVGKGAGGQARGKASTRPPFSLSPAPLIVMLAMLSLGCGVVCATSVTSVYV